MEPALAVGSNDMVNLPSGFGGALFTEAWQERYSRVPERGMNCQIVVTRTLPDDPAVYDPDIDDWVTPSVMDYTGKARVQPLRSTRWITPEGNDAPVLTVLFSIPITNAPTLYIGAQATVTVSPLNNDLTRYAFVIAEILDSGNPLERTFLATVNQESI